MICGDPIGISLYKEHLRFYLAIRVMIFLSAVLSKKAFQAKKHLRELLVSCDHNPSRCGVD